jgi:hypothetical protein
MYRFALPAIFLFCLIFQTSNAQQGQWTALFDGKSLSGWKQLAGNAKYTVEDGAIVGTTVSNTPNSFLVTDQVYSDFVLELEVKIVDTTSNSGIQFRSHHDPSGNGGKGKVFGYQYELDPSSRRWTAGIYDEGRRDWLYPLSLHPSAQNAFKLNAFNKVKIACVGHQLRTWINGIPAAYVVDTLDRSGFIALQVHAIGKPEMAGEKIYWKNIRIKPISVLADDYPKDAYVFNNIPNQLTATEKKNGWTLLFDGKTSRGWRGAFKTGFPAKGWQVEEGNMRLQVSGGEPSAEAGDIVTLKEYSAFDLSFDFRLTPGANSGLKYFVTLKEDNKNSALGLEYQVLDDQLHPDAKEGRDGDRTLASLYDLIPAIKQARFVHPVGQWNTGRIIVYPNNHVVHYLNGVKVLEYDRHSPAFRKFVAMSKFKDWPRFGEAEKGHILLQDHGFEVSFRSIKIRELR